MTLLFIVILAACGGGSEEPADTGSDNAGQADDKEDGADGAGETGGVNAEGMPIVDEEIEMTFFANKPLQNEDNDWNDILIWNHYRDLTGINVKWDLIHPDALEEQRNLSLQGDLPDAYFLSLFTMSDLITYGEQGLFIELNDLIDQYAPNLSALMEKDPSIRKGITFPNGKIYAMPSIVDEDFLSVRLAARPWINTDHLDELDMDMPKTTEEFYQFLKGIKELAPAGENTIPYGGTAIAELVQWLSGSFGIMNKGQVNTNFDQDPNDPNKVRFYASTDEYKELLTYLNKLYSEGLIDQQILDNDWGHFTGLAGEGSEAFSAYVFYDPKDFFGEEVGGPWTHMTVLEGPGGHKEYNKVGPSVWEPGNFVITSANENPAAAVRWMDYFYGDEGSELYYMGIENETFTYGDDGKAEYMDHILNPEGDTTFEQAVMKDLTWIGSINGILAADYFAGGESKAPSMEASADIEPFIPDEIWPRFTFTEEENEILSNQGTEVEKYVEEMRDKFISGAEDLANFDKYVETLEKMGLNNVIDAYQAAYERYQAN